MRVRILTAALTLSTFFCVSTVAQSSEESTPRKTNSPSFKMLWADERPCEGEIKDRIGRFELANDYICAVFEQLSSHIIGTNISSPSDPVENISDKLMEGLEAHFHLFYSSHGPFAGPDYGLVFTYSNTYRSEEEVVRHFDESSKHLILIVDNETVDLNGMPLGSEVRRRGQVTINECRYFPLTTRQLDRLLVANKIEIKLGNITGTLSKQTLQAIKDMVTLSDLSGK